MNLTEPIRQRAKARPEDPAIIRWNAVVTYRQLDRMLDAVARRTLDHGLRPGEVVGLAFPDLPGSGAVYKFFVLTLALARAGVAVKAAEESDEGLAACFTSDAGTVTRAPRKVVVDDTWFENLADTVEVADFPMHADGRTTYRIATTSGTTGTSKRVSLSQEMGIRRTEGGEGSAPFPEKPVAIVHIGPWSGAGFRNMLRTLYDGGTLVLARRPDEILRAIARHGVNYLLLAPAALGTVVDAIPAGQAPLLEHGWVEVTGSFLPQSLFEQARSRLCPNIVTSYGSTEAGGVAWGMRSDLEGHPGAVGFVIPGFEVQAVDDDHRPLPPGAVGRIRMRGRTCVDHYDDDPEATARAFRDGWFYPGDLGSVSADGMLSIAGRASDLINIGGNKISPTVIEEALLAVPGVADAAAFGVPDRHGIPEVWAALVIRGTLAKGRLEATCRGLAFAAPKRILRMDALPRNVTGKVMREELVKIALGTVTSGRNGGG